MFIRTYMWWPCTTLSNVYALPSALVQRANCNYVHSLLSKLKNALLHNQLPRLLHNTTKSVFIVYAEHAYL